MPDAPAGLGLVLQQAVLCLLVDLVLYRSEVEGNEVEGNLLPGLLPALLVSMRKAPIEQHHLSRTFGIRYRHPQPRARRFDAPGRWACSLPKSRSRPNVLRDGRDRVPTSFQSLQDSPGIVQLRPAAHPPRPCELLPATTFQMPSCVSPGAA